MMVGQQEVHSGASTGDGTLVCKEYPKETKDTGKSSGESAGDGTLEALKQGIHNGRKNTGEGTIALQDYVVCANGSAGAGTPEAWRNGIPHGFEGGKGAIVIGTEEKSVARGLIIDPGGGASSNINVCCHNAGEGKKFYPEITGKWRRNNPGELRARCAGRRGIYSSAHRRDRTRSKRKKTLKVHYC
jgi:hypothetical protein